MKKISGLMLSVLFVSVIGFNASAMATCTSDEASGSSLDKLSPTTKSLHEGRNK